MLFECLFFPQCQREVVTKEYLNFPKDTCPNISEPCWIPQIDSIVSHTTTSKLNQCDTMEEYMCMLLTLMKSRESIKKQCIKSCKSENYNILPRTGSLERFTKVCWVEIIIHGEKVNVPHPQDGHNYWKILLKLKLDSYTVFKYKERKFNDIISVVAAIGGSLGLFLGFSCYQLCSKLIISTIFFRSVKPVDFRPPLQRQEGV